MRDTGSRIAGRVIRFNGTTGYGFIRGDDGVDRFVHVTQVRGTRKPQPGQRVAFEHHDAPKGPAAVDVEVVAERSLGGYGGEPTP